MDTYNKSFNFTGLPDNTSFNSSILGIINMTGLVSNPSSTFVRTLSMYMYVYTCVCAVRTYVCMYVCRDNILCFEFNKSICNVLTAVHTYVYTLMYIYVIMYIHTCYEIYITVDQ